MDTFKIVLYVLFLLFCLPASYALGEYTCTSRAEKMGFKSDWGPVQGCMIKTPAGWVPIDAYRVVP